MINGQFTTNTQIAWLWSYNGTNFTYDPDGDAITNVYIAGIPSEAVIGNITGNIGFATQFSVAGQYQMTYQVKDARGALSDILKVVINIEPADGNTRPVCRIVYAPESGVVRANEGRLMISWKQSSDIDAGDGISDIKGLVFKNGSEVSTDIKDYLAGTTTDSLTLKFKEQGSYQIWLSVSDRHSAWSDWSIITISVKSDEAKLTNVKVNTNRLGDMVEGTRCYWIDYQKSMELAKTVSDPEWILNEVKSTYLPADLPVDQIGKNITISGQLAYTDGTPIADESVYILMPVTYGRKLEVSLTTDSSGNFYYDLPSGDYWATLQYPALYPFSGDTSGVQTKYANYSDRGVEFLYPTLLSIQAKNDVWVRNVSATVGIAGDCVIGDRFHYVCPPNESTLQWLEDSYPWYIRR